MEPEKTVVIDEENQEAVEVVETRKPLIEHLRAKEQELRDQDSLIAGLEGRLPTEIAKRAEIAAAIEDIRSKIMPGDIEQDGANGVG